MDKEIRIKLTGTILAELVTGGTVLQLIGTDQGERLALALGTLALVMLPAVVEKLFCCRIRLPVYIFALCYAMGPMLGHCWYLYYLMAWWDKLLHFSGGVIFAIVGAWLFAMLTRQKAGYIAETVFALCFSVAIAAIWEFAEFGADRLFRMDMQGDTFITGIHSYLLGQPLGVTGSVTDIQTVTVNGMLMPGYIDIGLFDTMWDMMLESLGACLVSILLLLDRGKNPVILSKKMA